MRSEQEDIYLDFGAQSEESGQHAMASRIEQKLQDYIKQNRPLGRLHLRVRQRQARKSRFWTKEATRL